jgi:hypothetical protein
MPKYQRNILVVILIGIAAYWILNLVFLDVKVGELIYNMINAPFYLADGKPELISRDMIAIVSDGVICIGGLLFWIFFFGQFVLPTHTLRERVGTPPLIFRLLSGERGPAIFIRDGKQIERSEESKGAGVILLDSASAAVLTKKGEFSRAVGPGLVFTQKNEGIAEDSHTVDLRTQVRTIGPDEDAQFFFKGEEDPPDAPSKDSKVREERRRMQTSGLTRDGIEIIPNITTIFKLDVDSSEGNSEFGYRSDAVKKAVLHQAIVPDIPSGTYRTVEWEWLPAHLAADLWREYLRKFKLNQLFNITEVISNLDEIEAELEFGPTQGFDKTAFNRISEMITLRLTQPYVQVMNDVGQLTKRFDASREYELLQNHGIRVIAVNISDLRLKEEETLIERWNATWLQQAIIQEDNNEKRHELRRRKGEEEAAMDFAISAIGQISRDLDKPITERPGAAATLRRLLRSTRAALVRNTIMIEEMTEERAHLDDMIEWLSNYQNGADEE